MTTRLTKAEMAEFLPAVLLLRDQVKEEEQELEDVINIDETSGCVRDAVEHYLYKEGGVQERRERLEGMVAKLQARQQSVDS